MGMDVGIDIGARKVKVVAISGAVSTTYLFEPSDARLMAETLLACANTLQEDRQRLIDEKRNSEI